MGYFNRDTNNRSGRDNRGGGRGFGGGRDAGRRNDGPREMFKTVCSSCGKECEVPFKPTNGKPVYCSECFERMSPRNDARPERGGGFDRPQRPERNRSNFGDRPQAPRVDNNKAQLDSIAEKLDRIISLLAPKTETVVTTSVVEEVKKVKAPKTVKVKKAKVVKEV